MSALRGTKWAYGAKFARKAQRLGRKVKVWPAMKGALGCASILGKAPSLLLPQVGIATFWAQAMAMPLRLVKQLYPPTRRGWIALCTFPTAGPPPRWPPNHRHERVALSVWTNGSATHNSDERCVAGASWCAKNGVTSHAWVTGAIPTNNMAEEVAVVMALLAWPSMDLRIHMDSRYVLELVDGGLLAMEQDGWLDLPYGNWVVPVSLTPLHKHLLYLLWWHNTGLSFAWVKGHLGDKMNNWADTLAKRGAEDPLWEFDVVTLWTPKGWVDDAPVLNHQSLAHLTYCMVREATPNPLLGTKFRPFCKDWTKWVEEQFGARLDILRHFPTLWWMDAPVGLKELLWKAASGSLPLGHHWYGKSDLGRTCRCGTEMSLPHVWSGCAAYDVSPLRDELLELLPTLCPRTHRTLDFDKWPSPFWYPLICLKALERRLEVGRKQAHALRDSGGAREWAIGAYLWHVWKQCMWEMAEPTFRFILSGQVRALQKALGVG